MLYGASGFLGQLVADHLARFPGRRLRWALAGRSRRKLERVRDQLVRIDPKLATLPLLLADSGDPVSMRELARAARVVISAVGPYIRHGEPLVAACAEAGTDYVDLAGEPEFVDLMWLRYHDLARERGARIIHCCGFDAVPHDLGAYFTVRQLPEGVPIQLEAFVRGGGQLSGGMLSTMATVLSRWRQLVDVRRERSRREGVPVDRPISLVNGRVRFDRRVDSWVMPIRTMEPLMVLRSAAADERYGSEFQYSHYLQVKDLKTLAGLAGSLSALAVAAQIPPVLRRLSSLSGRGVGPDAAERERGWFSVRFIGTGGGQTVYTEVSGGDPGAGESAKMLAESALCLAFDRVPARAGVQTPANALGQRLIRRLNSRGIRFEVLESLS